MSYILDALKKKETETTEAVPDLKSQHYHSEFEDDSSLNWKPIAVVAGILLSIALVYLAYSLGQKQKAETVPSHKPELQLVETAEHEKVQEKEQETVPKQTPEVTTIEQTNAAQNKLQVESKPLEMNTPVVQKVTPVVIQPRRVEPAPGQEESVVDNSIAEAQVATEAVANIDESADVPNDIATNTVNSDLQGLPAIRYTSHVYADNQKDRFVMLNGRSLGIGQRLPNGVKIVDILEDDLIISYQGKDYQIPSLTDIE
ncbi:MAG: general secretion pathway protein GspB [Gammaproteobacteria bacterium]|nr:general secretion pathway protein GspB [Gammaproteobacteria bacterium]